MHELTGTIKDISVDYFSKRVYLTLSIEEGQSAKNCYDELHAAEKLSFQIDKYREKRSLNANAYLWVLCTKLAEERSKDGMKVTKEDVYREEIKDLNIYRDYNDLPLPEAKTLQTAWGMLGTGWITEQVDYSPDGERVTIRCYYGSSQYNTAQMSRLIDNIVQDCQALGIETKTPDEIANLISMWGEEHKKHNSGR